MNREFLKLYNQELAILREQAAEFAGDYPGVAERLGGLLEDNPDPTIGGLLEGAAFLAARVQLKLKHEFSDFTTNMIDQLAPHYLAPTPSFVLVQASPKYGDPSLREGRTIARGAHFDAAYREAQRNVACRFTLVTPITLWPFEIAKAEYVSSAAALQALIPGAPAECVAFLRLQLAVRAAARAEDEPADQEAHTRPDLRFSSCRVKSLRFHLLGHEMDAVALYEQLFAHCRAVTFRVLDSFGDPVVTPGQPGMIRQFGFEENEALIPNDNQLFRGFDFLRDYFGFPRRFLGFDLADLGAVTPRLAAKTVDIVLAFDEAKPQLAAAIRKEFFALYAAPGINLFEKTLDRIPVRSNQYEFPVIPDRSRLLDYETNRVIRVFAHIPGAPQKVPVEALYSAMAAHSATGLSYTIRRLPRRGGVIGPSRRKEFREGLVGCDDGCGHAIAAEGLEAVQIVVAGIGLLPPHPATRERDRSPFVLGEQLKTAVVGKRRFQIVGAVEIRDPADAAGLATKGAFGDRGAGASEVGEADRVLSVTADEIHRQEAAKTFKVGADISLVEAGRAVALSITAPLHQASAVKILVVHSVLNSGVAAVGFRVAETRIGTGIAKRRKRIGAAHRIVGDDAVESNKTSERSPSAG
jgi:type VI protein secretion system component VasA